MQSCSNLRTELSSLSSVNDPHGFYQLDVNTWWIWKLQHCVKTMDIPLQKSGQVETLQKLRDTSSGGCRGGPNGRATPPVNVL